MSSAEHNNVINAPLPLSLPNGGTGASLINVPGALAYSTASAMAFTATTSTVGQMMQSNGTGEPAWSTATWPTTVAFNALVVGTGTNQVGTLATTVNSFLTTDGSGNVAWSTHLLVAWTAAASTPITAAVNTGYYITDASQVTITLPTSAPAGSIVAIVGSGAGGWVLAPGAGQTIKFIGSSASTSITSAEQYDCIEVLCVVANTTWVARSALTTGFTIS